MCAKLKLGASQKLYASQKKARAKNEASLALAMRFSSLGYPSFGLEIKFSFAQKLYWMFGKGDFFVAPFNVSTLRGGLVWLIFESGLEIQCIFGENEQLFITERTKNRF